MPRKKGHWSQGLLLHQVFLSLAVCPHGLPQLVKVAWEPTMCQDLCETNGLQLWVIPGSQSLTRGPHLSPGKEVLLGRVPWSNEFGGHRVKQSSSLSSPQDSLEPLILSQRITDGSQRGAGDAALHCLTVGHIRCSILNHQPSLEQTWGHAAEMDLKWTAVFQSTQPPASSSSPWIPLEEDASGRWTLLYTVIRCYGLNWKLTEVREGIRFILPNPNFSLFIYFFIPLYSSFLLPFPPYTPTLM